MIYLMTLDYSWLCKESCQTSICLKFYCCHCEWFDTQTLFFFILRVSLSLDELSESLIDNFVFQVDPRIFAEFNYFLGRQVNLDFLKSLVKHSYISTDNIGIVKVRTIENKISSRISSMRVVNDTSGIIIENS